MDYSFEMQQIIQALNNQAMATQALTDQLARQNEVNQQILEALLEITLQDAGEDAPRTDMEGNAI